MAQTGLIQQLERRMAALKLKPAQLSRRAGLNATAVRDIIEGKSKDPQRSTIEKLAKALGCAPGDLLGSARSPAGGGRQILIDERLAAILELDVRAGMGAGALNDDEPVVQEWRLPAVMLQAQTTAPIEGIRIITAYGDSMLPGIPPGTKLLVDTGDKLPSPPGIFVVHDGLGTVVKRVEHIAHSDPPTVRLTSDNGSYQTYERTLEEAHILGRVIGRWTWM
jgi:DNA-binding Xre family transcriptional regulator